MFTVAVIATLIYAFRKTRRSGGKSIVSPRAPQNFDAPIQSVSDRVRTRQTAAGDVHVADAKAHGHKGEEEHYDEIVGSLGDVNDEGCADLDGVRFIAHDAAYDGEEGARDYTAVVRAMVLGEILNEPRFKHPYRRK